MSENVGGGGARDEWVRRVLGFEMPRQPGAAGGGISLVAVARESLAWRNLCSTVQADVASLKTEVIAALQGSGLYDDDELDEARDELVRLDKIFSIISPDISALIDDAINAAPDARAASLQAVIGEIDKAETQIGADETIADAQDNGLRKLDLAGPAMAALGALKKGLQPLLAA